jgi:hypothetical protein
MKPKIWSLLVLLIACASGSRADEKAPALKAVVLSLPSGVQVTIIEAPFVPSDHRIQGCSRDGGPCLIDGRPPFGVSMGLPGTYVKNIEVHFGGRRHRLDTTDMYNAWGGRPLSTESVRYLGGGCDGPSYCTLRGIFSDGAGAFVVQWSVYEGVTTRTVITGADDIVDLFIRHIDPPEYD